MKWLVTKYLLTALIIVVVSELAKRSDRLGAFVASLPFVTILTLIWLQVEGQPVIKLSNHAWYTLWYTIPTLPMFLVFPFLVPRAGFWPALLLSAMVTVICFGLFGLFLRRFGINLI